MAMQASLTITEQVLLLPLEERLTLVERLLESLNGPVNAEIEAAWAAEAERRLDAVLSGDEETYPQEEVIAELRARRKA